MNPKLVIHCTLLALSMASLTASATPRPADETLMRTVKFTEIDLTREAGAAILYSRIKAAAVQLCGANDRRWLGAFARSRRCTQQAIARAVDDVNASALTSVHQKRAHRLMLADAKR